MLKLSLLRKLLLFLLILCIMLGCCKYVYATHLVVMYMCLCVCGRESGNKKREREKIARDNYGWM